MWFPTQEVQNILETFEEILNEADELISNGSREITLLGQNVNAYNDKNKRLSDIIYALQKKKDLIRIRYYTSHPKRYDERFNRGS